MPSITGLFPKHRETWLLWLILLVIVFPVYYFGGFYSHLNNKYEGERWEACPYPSKEEYCAKIDPGTGLELVTRAPAYVADFIEMPLEIWVTNTATRTQSAVVTVELKPSGSTSDNVHIRLSGADQEQNSVAFVDIPPHGGRAMATFMISVYGGSEGNDYSLDVRLKDKAMQAINYTSSFNPKMVLRLWIIQHLLSPPGANIVLPVSSLLVVSLSEGVYRASVWCRRRCMKENIRVWDILCENPVFWILLIGAILVAWLIVYFKIWSILAWYGLGIGLLAVVIGLALGCTKKIPPEEEKPAWIPPCKQALVSAETPISSASAGSGADQSLGSDSSSS
ncbi:MAG TPA: hypothetical protein ENN19_08210 [Chloroflexi bacterium]|nr:hypothetical protein [Chloroflexota bacterium]